MASFTEAVGIFYFVLVKSETTIVLLLKVRPKFGLTSDINGRSSLSMGNMRPNQDGESSDVITYQKFA